MPVSVLGNPLLMLGVLGLAIGVAVYEYVQSQKRKERVVVGHGRRPRFSPSSYDSESSVESSRCQDKSDQIIRKRTPHELKDGRTLNNERNETLKKTSKNVETEKQIKPSESCNITHNLAVSKMTLNEVQCASHEDHNVLAVNGENNETENFDSCVSSSSYSTECDKSGLGNGSCNSEGYPYVTIGKNHPKEEKIQNVFKSSETDDKALLDYVHHSHFDRSSRLQSAANCGYDKDSSAQETKLLATSNFAIDFDEENKEITKEEAISNQIVCKACKEDPVTTMTEPCEHTYLCSGCAPKVFRSYKKCCICKREIIGFKSIEK